MQSTAKNLLIVGARFAIGATVNAPLGTTVPALYVPAVNTVMASSTAEQPTSNSIWVITFGG
jgi:tellurite resistance protein TehA-like permease